MKTIAVERLKARLLAELTLMTPHLISFWRQVNWPKPDLVELSKGKTPLAFALSKLPPPLLAEASGELDPFGWLLAHIDVSKWSYACQEDRKPWMTRVCLATASQLLAEVKLAEKAHGRADTWEQLLRSAKENHVLVHKSKLEQIHASLIRFGFRRVAPGVFRVNDGKTRFREVRFFYHRTDPEMRCVVVRFNAALDAADEFFFSQLRHAKAETRAELFRTPGLAERIAKAHQERDEAYLRRLRRARRGGGRRAGVSPAEKFIVQSWLELPHGLPGLCFFHDSAIHALLDAFGLETGEADASKQVRVRLGLIQAAAKGHLVEQVIAINGELRFTGRMMKEPIICRNFKFFWNTPWEKRQLWPPRG